MRRYAYTYLEDVKPEKLEGTLNEWGDKGWKVVYINWDEIGFGWDIVMEWWKNQ